MRLATLTECGTIPDSVKRPELVTMLKHVARFHPDVRKKMADELRESANTATPGQAGILAQLKSAWSEMVPKFRILCLSEIYDVTPMWLHYADQYRGIVFQFSALDELDSAFLVARPVIYQDTPPSIADPQTWVDRMLGGDLADYEDLFTEYQYVKTTAWSYEREWRVVSVACPGERGPFADYGFHPRELTGIYLGPECPQEDRFDILALLAHGFEHVHVYEASLDSRQAKFVFRPLAYE